MFTLALVTGATSGIGEELARLLAQKKIPLLLTGRNEHRLADLQRELSSQVSVQTICADLSLEEDRKKIIGLIHQFVPQLVINNAGYGLYGEALSYTTPEQLDILNVNGVAVAELTLEAARTLFSKNQKGVIVNVSSVAAYQIFPSCAMYASTKAFVNQFSQSFDFEMQKYGIRVLTVCPGMVATHFKQRAGNIKESKEKWGVMSSQFVADTIWQQIQSLKTIHLINWKYRILTYLSFLLPKKWRACRLKQIIESEISPRNPIKIDS